MQKIRFPIEAGHILQFARAIGDPNPVYHDAERAAATEVGGVIAPPTFTTAASHFDPGYRLRPKLGEPWFGSGREPSGVVRQGAGGGGGLHAEQHYEYHRPVRPGEVLYAETHAGKTWEKQGRRGGNLEFSERITEFRDGEGALVVTERSVSVRTERVAVEEDRA